MNKRSVRQLYFDESGFTGYNLLDASQPHFTIVSTDISPSQSEDILRSSFPRYRAIEYKSTNLWKAKDKSGFLRLAEHLATVDERVFIWTAEKKFVVLTKIIDFLVEPFITGAGFDFYSDDFARRYVNYVHFGFTHFAPSLYDNLLADYQVFSRDPTDQNLERLRVNLQQLLGKAPEDIHIFLEQMILGVESFSEHYDFSIFRSSNDIYLTTMIAIVGHWRGKCSEDFKVIHDASAHFFRQKSLWQKITSPSVHEQLFPTGVGPDINFPLRVIETRAEDSKQNYSIQLCDVIAGTAGRHLDQATTDENRSLLNEIMSAGFGNLSSNGMRPTEEFPLHIPPRPLEGPDAVDRMSAIIFGPTVKGTKKK